MGTPIHIVITRPRLFQTKLILSASAKCDLDTFGDLHVSLRDYQTVGIFHRIFVTAFLSYKNRICIQGVMEQNDDILLQASFC